MSEKITISVEGEWELDVNDVWPDGDAPEHPTAADVVRVMEADCHDAEELLSEWSLGHGLRMSAIVRGESESAWH